MFFMLIYLPDFVVDNIIAKKAGKINGNLIELYEKMLSVQIIDEIMFRFVYNKRKSERV